MELGFGLFLGDYKVWVVYDDFWKLLIFLLCLHDALYQLCYMTAKIKTWNKIQLEFWVNSGSKI